MIRLMKKTALKNGEIVTPFLIEGKNVYCHNGSKKTIIRKLTDFNTTPKLPNNVVTPEIYQTDELFTKDTKKLIKPTAQLAPEPSTTEAEPVATKPVNTATKPVVNIYEEDYI